MLSPLRLSVLFFLLLASFSLFAQEVPVRLRVLNARSERVAGATVQVTAVADSSRQEGLSDSSGNAGFRLAAGGQYIVQVTSVGYQPLEKGIRVGEGNPVFTFILEPSSKQLGAVVITSSRPLMRQEDDRTIVDPEHLAAASTNAFEIVEKVPGLFVDQDGNIYLNSTTPATVYINGREQKMSAADMATVLKSLPPGSIASIEILRTPSARYDASGSGGIVNVILKKGVRIGLTGSINAGFNQGSYGNRFTGININNNNGRLSTYLNLQYSQRNTYDRLVTDRIFAADSVLGQNAFTRYGTGSYYGGYGLSYEFKQDWELSYDGRIGYNSVGNRSTNLSAIRRISSGELVESNTAFVENKGYNYSLTQGLSLRHKLDSLGSEWTTDLSYTRTPNSMEQLFTAFFPASGNTGGDGAIESRLQFYSVQSHLVKKFRKQLTLEAGGKSSNVDFRNATDYFRQAGGARSKDDFRTRSYRYEEHIHSAYGQASKTVLGITFKGGVRMEHTDMNGRQTLPGDTSFRLQRTDFFPYLYISRNLMKIAGYDLRAYLVYRRTISRPAYEYLNPFPRYVDPYLFETGNPSLRPQFTRNYEANISVDERPIIAIGFNDTRDIFTNVIYQSADSSRSLAYRTWDNLGTNKETYFRALGAIPPGKRYFFVAGTQYNHNFYEGLYEGRPLSFKRGSWTFFTYQTFRLTPVTQLSLSGFARFKGQQQFYELTPFGSLRMSLSQQLMKKKLTFTLSAEDLFFTNNNEFVMKQGSVDASGYRESDTRRFGLNLRYNFGFRKKEEQNIFNVETPGS